MAVAIDANNSRGFNKIINTQEVKIAFKKVKTRPALTNKNTIGIKLHSETIFKIVLHS
jgi:hypothetical protein